MPELPRLTSGAVGFVGYDAVRQLETLSPGPPDTLGLPDGVWGFYDTLAAFDHVRHQLVLMATAFVDDDTDLEAAYAEATERLVDLEDDLLQGAMPGEPVRLLADEPTSRSSATPTRPPYGVARSTSSRATCSRWSCRSASRCRSPATASTCTARSARSTPPVPVLPRRRRAQRRLRRFTLVGSSPEVLTRVERHGPGERRALVLPIAGHAAPRRDARPGRRPRRADLLADPKERAEHLMLVDLGRNDLGRVAETGTVRVDRFAEVERFSHVMHIVSSVSGAVAGRDATDILAACFPAGTVSGAPKVRAMEIIDELEPIRRGPYAGAVGYAGFDGALDTCIAIRTIVVTQDDVAYVQAGAGIVADSDPAAEFDETHAKAAALFAAMRSATSDLL